MLDEACVSVWVERVEISEGEEERKRLELQGFESSINIFSADGKAGQAVGSKLRSGSA